MKTDVLIIGGGIAGATAALKARAMERSVILVTGRPGASTMHSGIFDTDADPGRVPDISMADDRPFAENLVSVNAANPLHPFSIALGDPDGEDIFLEAISFFLGALNESGLKTAGSMGGRMLLANNLGTLKRPRFALSSLAAGDLHNHDSMKIAIVGIAGLPEFDSKFITASLSDLLPRATGSYHISIESYEVALPGLDNYTNLTPFSIAQLMDEPGFAEIFADAVKEKVTGVFTHIGFPAVLGIRNHANAVAALQASREASVFEIVTVQPSVPGKRISVAIEKQLSRAGVNILGGTATGFSASGGEITSVSAKDRYGKTTDIEPAAVVLATGRFIGGGILHDESLREPFFNLQVITEKGPIKKQTPLMDYASSKISDRQQLLTCGVRVDSDLRGLNSSGKPAFDNLFCAGSVIGGYDPYRDGCGTGVAAVTGYIAGISAAGGLK